MREMFTKVIGLTKLTGQNIISSILNLSLLLLVQAYLRCLLYRKSYTNSCGYKTEVGFHPQ